MADAPDSQANRIGEGNSYRRAVAVCSYANLGRPQPPETETGPLTGAFLYHVLLSHPLLKDCGLLSL
jgi:hypothetical protein